MRLITRMARWAAIAIVGLVLLVVAAYGVAQTEWAKSYLNAFAVSQANRHLTARLAIGRLRGSLLHGVTLEDVSLTGPDGEIVRVARVDLRYNPLTLARRQLILDEVHIVGASIRVVDTNGEWNVSHIARPSAGPSNDPATPFEIRHLLIEQSDVSLVGPGLLTRHVSALNVDGRLAIRGERLEVEVAEASGRDDRTGAEIKALRASVKGADDVAAEFEVVAGAQRLAGRVSIRTVDESPRVTGAIDVSHLNAALFTENDALATDVTSTVTFQGVVTAGAPQLTFDARGPAVAAFGYLAATHAVTGRYENGALTADATLSAYDADLTAHVDTTLAGGSSTPMGVTASGAFRGVALAKLPSHLEVPPLATRLSGQYKVQSRGTRVVAHVTLDESEVEGARIAGGTTIDVTAGDQGIRYAATGDIANLMPAKLAGPLGVPALSQSRLDGAVTGAFDVRGFENCRTCLPRRTVDAHVTFDQARLHGATLDGLDAVVALNGSQLDLVARGRFRNLSGEVLGAPMSMPAELNGGIDARLSIANVDAPLTIDALRVDGQVELEPSRVRDIDIAALRVDGTLEGGLATIRAGTLEAAGVLASATGVIAVSGDGQSSFEATVDSEDLAPIARLLGVKAAGAAHIEGTVTGPAKRPAIAGVIQARQLDYAGTVSALTAHTTFKADVPNWKPEQAIVEADGEATFIRVSGTDLVRAGLRARYQNRRLDVEASGEDRNRSLEMSGSVDLAAAERSVRLDRLSLATNGAAWSIPDGAPVTVGYGNDLVTVDSLRLVHDAQTIAASGAIRLKPVRPGDRPQTMTVTVDALELADVNRLMLGTRRVTGTATGAIVVRGSVAEPDVEAEVTVTNGSVEDTPFESLMLAGQMRASRITLDAALQQAQGNRVTMSGSLPWRDADPAATIDLTVRSSSIDLGLAQLFTSELQDLSGTAQVDVHVGGTLKAPRPVGRATVADGAFLVESTGVRYRALNADVSLDGPRLRIAQLSVQDQNKHEIRVAGTLDVLGDASARTLDVRVKAESVRVLDNPLGSLEVAADLTVVGDLSAPQVQGTVTLDSGRLEVDQILERTTKNPYDTEPAAVVEAREAAREPALEEQAGKAQGQVGSGPTSPGATGPGAAGQGAPRARTGPQVRIALKIPDNLVIRGRGLKVGASPVGLGDVNIIVGGTLDLQMANETSVVGNLQVIRGNYTFQGRRFEVQRGSDVRFRGERPIDPTLNVTAERDVSGVAAEVHVGGRATNPRITLSSRPPLEDADILSLIIFGQPANSLGTGERTSLAQRAGALTAGAIATPIADSVARALDLDVFEIQTPSDSERAPVVSVGSQIGSRLYLGVRQEIGGEQDSAVSFEYRIATFLRLVTSFAQGALQQNAGSSSQTGGVDLLFVFRY